MKSMVIAALALLMGAATVKADEPAVDYYTNALELAQISARTGVLRLFPGKVNPSELGQVDSIIVGAAHAVDVGTASGLLPLSSKRWYDEVWYTNAPNYATFEFTYWYNGHKPPEDTDIWANRFDGFEFNKLNEKWVANWKSAILKKAVTPTKKQLRSEGKTFVAKDGKNPVQDRLDALTKALDSARMENVSNAFASCGIKFTVEPEKILPSFDEVEKLRQDIYEGSVDFTAHNKAILLVGLGVTGYNEFVKKYNGDAE